jgi:tRNA pseudouridine32 synthase/23S rRNA pseudouridine746 synthase
MSTASRAPTPSHITLPPQAQPYPALLDFLSSHFPHVGREVWQARLTGGKVTDETGAVVTPDTPYRVNARLRYYREVSNEPRIPFEEHIVYEDECILIADKPHFLPVTPSGPYVNECLMHRLQRRTGNLDLVAAHRLDRETAGLVLFTRQKALRTPYFELFSQSRIEKRYEAIATLPTDETHTEWLLESRIVRGEPWYLQQQVEGVPNARSRVRLLETNGTHARFELEPISGKTHQLRLHLGLIGSQIVNDGLYPELLPRPATPDYSKPLQLLARSLAFTDPVTGRQMQFKSDLELRL